MKSWTYGEVSMKEMVKLMHSFTKKHNKEQNRIIIGTDSQNFATTKIVMVIALHAVGNGGIFFYEITRIPKMTNIKHKLITETNMSLKYAKKLIEEFERQYDETGFDYTKYDFCIHVDAGINGKSKTVIPEITAWVNSCGFQCEVKPKSFVASTIADKLSK